MFGIVVLAVILFASGSRVSASTAIDPAVLAAREAAWRAYFAGDVKALGDLLPEEFIGISMEDTPYTNRAQTLDGARAFRELVHAGADQVALVSRARWSAHPPGLSRHAGAAVWRRGRALWPIRSGDPFEWRGAHDEGPADRDLRPSRREMGASRLASRPDG